MSAEKQSRRILIVDDEPQVREVLAAFLGEQDYQVDQAASGEAARDLMSAESFDVVFTDLSMPGMNGLELLRLIQREHPETAAVVMTAYGSMDTAVQAMRAGAVDYLTKPLSLDEILDILPKAFERCDEAAGESTQEPGKARRTRRGGAKGARAGRRLVGQSPAVRRLNELIARVAASDSTVLIRGASGTGKELVADALHRQSPRAAKPLVPVNCGAIPEDLLESELFGHVRGSFTGAIADRVGRFVIANGGTIFLDEIGDMSAKLQVKILRVLQEQELEPVGSADTVRVDVRVIAATNVDLERAVAQRLFREDLYYRLNVIPVEVPPLSARVEDIPLLVEHFLSNLNRRAARRIERFDDGAMELLCRYPWPGNVRELENLVERMSVLAAGEVVGVEDLPEKIRDPQAVPVLVAASPGVSQASYTAEPVGGLASSRSQTSSGVPGGSLNTEGVAPEERVFLRGGAGLASDGSGADRAGSREVVQSPSADFSSGSVDLNELVDEYERRLILEALERAEGVKSRAADILCIKRTTLVEKMKKKDIVYEGA